VSGPSVLSVVSEVYPLVKTGGLADVAAALPPALAAEDVQVCTMVPGYPAVLAALDGTEPGELPAGAARATTTVLHEFAELYGGPARLLRGPAAGLDLIVLDAPHLFMRPGSPYMDPSGKDWPDNAWRFAALSRAAAMVAQGRAGAYLPDLVHAHEWQAGLVPAYLRVEGGPPTVMTIHNLAFQGQYPVEVFGTLGLPPSAWGIGGVEYYGGVGYLKAGIAMADAVTTVSPSYAAEIRTPEAGMGLDGLLRQRGDRLLGILNGIDPVVWNPETDRLLPAQYSAARLAGRAVNKAVLQTRLGLDVQADALLYGVVSRLTWQKGLDLLLRALPALLGTGAQLAVLGTGEPGLQAGLLAATAAHPGRVGCVVGYDEGLAHLMQAGADALVVPSRFEPCGLTQLCALRYGALPVVSRVGGLSDTVVDANEMAVAGGNGTGVVFAPPSYEMLEAAFLRTASLWRDPALWRRLQRNGMRTDVSWRRPAARYAALFRDVLAGRAA
jgi:starch synthase